MHQLSQSITIVYFSYALEVFIENNVPSGGVGSSDALHSIALSADGNISNPTVEISTQGKILQYLQ